MAEGASKKTPHRSRLRLVVGILAAFAGAAAVIWLLRDLPRRRVEHALAGRLGADVSLGSLTIQGSRDFILHDLTIRRMASQPRIQRLHFDTLYVSGSLGDITEGRFETLRAIGLEARLQPPPSEAKPAAPEAEPLNASIGRLEIAQGRIVFVAAGGADETVAGEAIDASGTLTGIGGDEKGEIRLASGHVRIEPILDSLFGPNGVAVRPRGSLEGFEASVRIGERGGRIEIDAGATRGSLDATGGPIALPSPGVILVMRSPPEGGAVHVEIEPRLSILESGTVTAELDTSKGRLVSMRAHLQGMQAGPVLAVAGVLPEGWKASGTIDLDADGENDRVDYDLSSHALQAEIPIKGSKLETQGATLRARGRMPLGDPAEPGRIDAALEVPSLRGDIAERPVPAEIFPLKAAFDGTLDMRREVWFDGRASLDTAMAGRLEAIGRVLVSPAAQKAASAPGAFAAPGAAAPQTVATPQPVAAPQTAPSKAATSADPTTPGQPAFAVQVATSAMAAFSTRVVVAHSSIMSRAASLLTAFPRIPPHDALTAVSTFRTAEPQAVATLSASSRSRTVPSSNAVPSNTPPPANAGAAAPSLAFDLRWSWKGARLERLAAIVQSLGLAVAGVIDVRGACDAQGTMTGTTSAPRIAGTVALESLAVGSRRGGIANQATTAKEQSGNTRPRAGEGKQANTQPSAMAGAKSSLSPTAAAGASHSIASISSAGSIVSESPPVWSLHDGNAHGRFLWTGPSAPIEITSLEIAGGVMVSPLERFTAKLTARGEIDPRDGLVRLNEAMIDAPGLGRARIHGDASFSIGGMTARTSASGERSSVPSHGAASTAPSRREPVSRRSSGEREPRTSSEPGPAHTSSEPEPPRDSSEGTVGERGAAAVHLEAIELARWQKVLRPALGDFMPGYSLKGTVEADLACALGADGIWSGTGKAQISRNGFSSTDGSQVVEGLDMKWDLALAGGLEGSPITLHATADVGGFQVLWGSFFADVSPLTSKLEVQAELRPAATHAATSSPQPSAAAHGSARPPAVGNGSRSARPASLSAISFPRPMGRSTRLAPPGSTPSPRMTARSSGPAPDAVPPWSLHARALWSFAQDLHLDVSCDAAPGGPLQYTAEFEARDLRNTVEKYLRGPLGDTAPFFRKLEASGSLHADVRGVLSDSQRSVAGRLHVQKLRLAGTERVAEVQGLDLDLPVDLTWGPPDQDGRRSLTGAEHLGKLTFSSLDVMGFTMPSAETGLRIRTDTVELEEGLAVELLGGVLVLEKLRLLDLLRPSRHLESALIVSGVSLAETTRAFGLPLLEGTLEATFPGVRLSLDTLEVEGGGEARVFGGTVKLGGISGEDILSRYPKLRFSAEFSGIDMDRLTHTFDFGEITGFVDGYVRDCELFRGVPVAFEARVETEEGKGVPRTVNVKAIKNLTILGTGTQSSIFDRGIHKFFKKYTYDRIGILMSLKDDRFVLRGLERRGDQELFVKGRLPFPINVVNMQPGEPISFQDMVDRIQNLDVSTITIHR